MNANNPGSRDRTVVVNEKLHPHAAPDKAQLQLTFLVYGAL
jgi:hypothetical protein